MNFLDEHNTVVPLGELGPAVLVFICSLKIFAILLVKICVLPHFTVGRFQNYISHRVVATDVAVVY